MFREPQHPSLYPKLSAAEELNPLGSALIHADELPALQPARASLLSRAWRK
jgi:hypothetical protein